ncbi:EF-hand domain-containing family member C2 [Durusdinium trenchii]|uniref:EF-hand domain-containing family member C2 n=1 Tax=Durusdinium trenchii TaxID=1381693 RepID=A0ABP0IAS3_9DINO
MEGEEQQQQQQDVKLQPEIPKQAQVVVPKLNLGSVPLLPGFRTHRDVDRLQPWHGKKSFNCTERLERKDVPEPDLVFHVHGKYSAKPTAPTREEDEKERFKTSQQLMFMTPKSPRNMQRPFSRRNGRDKWLVHDREVLRFFLYFKEAVPESPAENFRVRKLTLLFYRSDDTVQILEPKEENSGLTQGAFLAKTPIKSLPGPSGTSPLTVNDLIVGYRLHLFGRTFMIVDVDAKTRRFFTDELGFSQPSALPYPKDPRALQLEKAQSPLRVAKVPKPDSLKQFLKFGDKALVFNCLWDDSAAECGDKRTFNLSFFLADHTIEIKETFKPNSGREGFSKFLTRNVVLNPATGQSYGLADLRCGATLDINGRPFLLLSCDSFTTQFYAKHNLGAQVPVRVEHKPKVLPRMPVPPYNGYGTEQDSLGSFYHLVPKPPRQNFERIKQFGNQCFHIRCELVTDIPQELGRTFDLSFHLADQTLALFEPVKRNSGITGGKFLERGSYVNTATGQKVTEADLGVALKTAIDKRNGLAPADDDTDVVTILSRTYKVLSADDFTYGFFEITPPSQPPQEEATPQTK